MSGDHSVKNAVLSINASMAVFVVGDVFVKLLGQSYASGEVIFLRSCLIAVVTGLGLVTTSGRVLSRKLVDGPMIARCAFDCVNVFSFVIAIVHLKIAELYAIILTSPFLMTVFAVLFFKEPVGWRRWAAIAFGFAGALLIIKPDTHAFNYWAAVALLCSVSAACRDLVTPKIDRATSVLEVTFAAALLSSVAALLFGLSESWSVPTPTDGAVLAVMTSAWVFGSFLLIHACRIGPIFIVASFRYTLLVWGSIAGYFVFGDVPDIWSVLGALIIMLSGFYVFHREAVRRRAIASRV